MSNVTPTFGTLGTLSASLQQEIGADVQMEPDTSANTLLADGSTSVDLVAIEQALSGGKSVTVVGPSDAVARELGALTGGGVPLDAALVTLYNGRNRYQMSVTPRGTLTLSSATDSGPSEESETTRLAIGASLASVLPKFQTPTATLQDQLGNLTPPSGSYAGYSFLSGPATLLLNPPKINNQNDDDTVSSQQTITDSILAEFFVYWVNGTNNGSGTPYYIVILKQSGTMSSGDVQVNGGHSLGWFQQSFLLTPNTVFNADTKQPFDSSIATVSPVAQGHSPSTGPGPIGIYLSVPMTVWADVAGGTGPNAFTATVNDGLLLSQWAVQDLTSGNETSWLFYQDSVWNPVQNTFLDFGTWFAEVYSGNNVDAMTAAATGSIPFETVSAWRIDSPSFQNLGNAPEPVSLAVEFSGGWSHDFAFLHSPAGCRGIEGTHHHLFGGSGTWNWTWSIDLGAIARKQNIS